MRPSRFAIAPALALALLPVALATVSTARAQGPGPTIVVPSRSRPFVTGYSPDAGPPGTIVTVTGGRLSPALRIVFGGRELPIAYRDEYSLQFAVPDAPGGAPILLRDPGRDDLPVGNFLVTSALELRSFAPRSGPPGTRIEIVGTGFERGDVVQLGVFPLQLLDAGSTRLVVQVPLRAVTAELVVSRPSTGQAVRSRQPFVVTAVAPPYVTGVTPAAGPPGTPVRVAGGNFGPEDGLFYGDRPVQVTGRGDDFLDGIIPPEARSSERLWVRGPRGEAASPGPFRLGGEAEVHSFEPTAGPPGTRVEISGDGLQGVDEVRLDRQGATILFQREHRLVIEIPQRAATGPLVLLRGGVPIGRSPAPFVVVGPVSGPVIRGFSPPGGPPGATVTISGDGFGPEVRVAYGDQALPILARERDDVLTVVVPRGATRSAPFVVVTRGGETRSGAFFQLQLAARIDSITPTSGPPGTAITVRGADLRGDEQFYLGDQPARVVQRQPWGYVLEAPEGRGGPLAFDSGGQRTTTPFRFDVLGGLAAPSFRPTEGPPGTRVLLRGRGAGDALRVVYGGLACAIVRRGHDEVVVEIPQGAAGQDVFWIEAYGQRVRTADAFRVQAPYPTVGAFAPQRGRPGTTVVLAATGFGRNASVFFGSQECKIVQMDGRQIVFVVPPRTGGRAPFTVMDDEGYSYTTTQIFEVERRGRDDDGDRDGDGDRDREGGRKRDGDRERDRER